MGRQNNLTLELHQLRREDIRRGWVRIHREQRKDQSELAVPVGKLIEVSGPTGSVLRVVYGLPRSYKLGGKSAEANWVCIDELDREAIGFGNVKVGSAVSISIKTFGWYCRWLKWLSYALTHPDIPLKASSWIAMILGFVSLVVSILPLWLPRP